MSSPTPAFLQDAVFLVDASSYVFRAYYAIQRPLTAPDGTPTHATFGFLQMVQALVDMHELSHCVLVWDRPGKGFRHEVYPEYKANRVEPPEDLGVQIENAREAAGLLGLPQLDAQGFEADDILATIIRKNPQRRFVIVTADKDLLQLVGPNVWCLDTMRDKWSNVVETEEKFGVEPARVPEVQALCGDSVDNIPGVPGVGPKTASELIRHFGSLDAVLAEAKARAAQGADGKWKDKLKGKCLENVAAHSDDARLSLELVTLRADVPVETSPEHLAAQRPRTEDFRRWALRLGFARAAERLLVSFGKEKAAEASAATALPKKGAPVEEENPAGQGLLDLGSAPRLPMDPPFATEVVRDLDALRAIFRTHTDAPLLALDTETFSLEHLRPENLVGFSLSFDDAQGYYVPLRHRGEDAPNLPPREALAILGEYLAARAKDAAFALVFQNAKFDLHAFANDGLAFPSGLRIDDTMVASFVLDPAGQHGLDALSLKHLHYRPLSFEEVTQGNDDFAGVPLESAGFYAAEDAVVCRRLWSILSQALRDEKLWDVYDGIDRPLIPILVEMERTGVLLDTSILQDLSKLFHRELAALHEKAMATLRESGVDVSPDLNLNSPKQLSVILYEQLKLPVLKRTKTGPSTDASVLAQLAETHEFPEILLEIREVSKLLSTYVDAFPSLVNPRTGRIHTDFSQTVAATGRLASSNPNLQNIPIKTRRGREIRKAFRAPEGAVLLGIDYSQIELRLLAHVSRDPELLRAFQDDADVHKRTAALVLGKDEARVTDDDRRIAKTVNYGIVYGQTAFGLAKQLKISKQTAQSFIDAYFKTYAGIRGYMDAAIREAKDTGAVRTLSGRRRPLPEIHSRNAPLRQFAERMAINSPLQGLAADLMKVGMVQLRDRLRKEMPEAKMLLQVHDELVFEVPKGQADRLRALAAEVLEDPTLLKRFGIPSFAVHLKAEAGIGENWGEL